MKIYDVNEIGTLCNDIIKGAMTPSLDVPKVPRANRFGMRTSIFVMDEIPSSYIVEKVGTLDFWNEIEGFFLKNFGVPTYDLRKESWELPELIRFSELEKISIGEYKCTCVGDRVVDKEYDVYKIVGFVNSDGSSNYYFNIK